MKMDRPRISFWRKKLRFWILAKINWINVFNYVQLPIKFSDKICCRIACKIDVLLTRLRCVNCIFWLMMHWLLNLLKWYRSTSGSQPIQINSTVTVMTFNLLEKIISWRTGTTLGEAGRWWERISALGSVQRHKLLETGAFQTAHGSLARRASTAAGGRTPARSRATCCRHSSAPAAAPSRAGCGSGPWTHLPTSAAGDPVWSQKMWTFLLQQVYHSYWWRSDSSSSIFYRL